MTRPGRKPSETTAQYEARVGPEPFDLLRELENLRDELYRGEWFGKSVLAARLDSLITKAKEETK
jgi:hypothetical protein